MEQIDLRTVEDCVDRALELLRRTYRSTATGIGGWYHSLDSDKPGPSATGVGLASFVIHKRPFEHHTQCLGFLKNRQIRSTDPGLDGGWAVNTSFGQPVTEATALIARTLPITRTLLTPGAPDGGRARQWLISNQNDDGGWGSFHGQTSRVWLTAMAVRALAELDPFSASIQRGAHWLVKQREATSHAWGEQPFQAPTVTHTAYVLTALVDSRLATTEPTVASAIEAGYLWLLAHLDPTSIYDDRARVESYNVTRTDRGGQSITWQSTVWHHGLPFAVSALTRHPHLDRFDLLCRAVRTVTRTQMETGRWPSADSAAAMSIWTLWPFLEALADVRAHTPAQGAHVMSAAPLGAVVIQPAVARVSIARLFWAGGRRQLRRWFARYWAAAVLTVSVLTCGSLVIVDKVAWKEFAIGMMFPVLLLVIQRASTRRRHDD